MKYSFTFIIALFMLSLNSGCNDNKFEKQNDSFWISFEKESRSDTARVMKINPLADGLTEALYFHNDSCRQFSGWNISDKVLKDGGFILTGGDARQTAKILKSGDSLLIVEYSVLDMLEDTDPPKIIVEKRRFYKFPVKADLTEIADMNKLKSFFSDSLFELSNELGVFDIMNAEFRETKDADGSISWDQFGKAVHVKGNDTITGLQTVVQIKPFKGYVFVEIRFSENRNYSRGYILSEASEDAVKLMSYVNGKPQYFILKKRKPSVEIVNVKK